MGCWEHGGARAGWRGLPLKLLALPGTFCALFLGGYTGVLMATTSVPLWSRSKLLGGVFLSSALSTSSALISLALRIFRAPASSLHKLERMEWTALLVEISGLLVFLRGSGRAARPLVGTNPGEKGQTFWSVVAGSGLVLPWLLQSANLARKNKKKRASGLLISLLVLVGGYFLRKTIVEAGHTSSKDARDFVACQVQRLMTPGGIGVALLLLYIARDVHPPFHWRQTRLVKITGRLV